MNRSMDGMVYGGDISELQREGSQSYWAFSSHLNDFSTVKQHRVTVILDAGTIETIDEVRLLILSPNVDEVIGNLRDAETTQPIERQKQRRICRRVTLPIILPPIHLHRPPSVCGPWRHLTKLRILYDRVFFPPRGHPFHVRLKEDDIYRNGSAYLPTYSIYRILPTNARERVSLPFLPASVLRVIVRDSLDEDYSHSIQNARRTLALALLSKAWLVVLDIIWERPLDKEGRFPKISLRMFSAITKSVEENPGHALRWLCFPQVEDWFRSANERERTQAVVRVFLEHAANLKSIQLSSQLYVGNQETLMRLRKIEEFRMYGSDDDQRKGHPLSLSNVMDTVLSWEALQTLWVFTWSESKEHHRHISVKYQLRRLTLLNGPLPGAHLKALISNSTRSLRVLRLSSITGLKNQDIYEVLISVSENLEEVTLTGLDIAPSTGEDEERAFDASLERMVRLRRATVHTSVASNLAITRKKTSQIAPHSELSLISYPHEYIRPETDPAGVGILAAIERTGWSKIKLSVLLPSSGNNEAILEKDLLRAMESNTLDVRVETRH